MKRFLITVLAFTTALFISTSFAQMNDSDTDAWAKYQELGVLTNCSAGALNGTLLCGGTRGIKTRGYNALTLEFDYTRSAGTGWQCYIQTCYEGHTSTTCTATGDWHTVAVEFPNPAGIQLFPGPLYRDVSVSDNTTYTIGLNYQRVRLSCTGKGSPTASDKLTVNGRIGWLYAF